MRGIKDLDRTFAQLAQFGEFKKMASLFAANGTLQWGTEVATGRRAIQNWLTTDAGAMNGIVPGSLNFQIIDNPSVNLSADGHTAKGRWNGLRFMGDGNGARASPAASTRTTTCSRTARGSSRSCTTGGSSTATTRGLAQLRQCAAAGRPVSLHARLGGRADSGPVGPGAAHQPARRGPARAHPGAQRRGRRPQRAAQLRRLRRSPDVERRRRPLRRRRTLDDRRHGDLQGSAGIRQALEQTMGPERLAQFILNEHPLWDTIVEVQPGARAIARGME